MDNIIVYGQEHCPKCDTLKSFLEDLGIPFKSLDMAEHRAYLDARDAFPPDAGAPVLELRDPVGYEDSTFWNHADLFEHGKLQTGTVEHIVGVALVSEWE